MEIEPELRFRDLLGDPENRSKTGLPGGSDGREAACRKLGFDPWIKKIPMEKRMATHSSTLAWRIPWTEEPGGLWFMGSQRVGHD